MKMFLFPLICSWFLPPHVELMGAACCGGLFHAMDEMEFFWMQFKQTYNRNYDGAEECTRFRIFLSNINKVSQN